MLIVLYLRYFLTQLYVSSSDISPQMIERIFIEHMFPKWNTTLIHFYPAEFTPLRVRDRESQLYYT